MMAAQNGGEEGQGSDDEKQAEAFHGEGKAARVDTLQPRPQTRACEKLTRLAGEQDGQDDGTGQERVCQIEPDHALWKFRFRNPFIARVKLPAKSVAEYRAPATGVGAGERTAHIGECTWQKTVGIREW